MHCRPVSSCLVPYTPQERDIWSELISQVRPPAGHSSSSLPNRQKMLPTKLYDCRELWELAFTHG